jgi:hypothetical protein
MCVCVYINMNEDDESMLPSAGPEAEESPLRLFDDILHNRMIQKNQEMHRTHNRSDIETYILLLVEKS